MVAADPYNPGSGQARLGKLKKEPKLLEETWKSGKGQRRKTPTPDPGPGLARLRTIKFAGATVASFRLNGIKVFLVSTWQPCDCVRRALAAKKLFNTPVRWLSGAFAVLSRARRANKRPRS
ncbi:hypothetical protein PG984_014614 [Apiospora sp. TS-2023a]